MLTIQITRINPEIYEIHINNTFCRYLSKKACLEVQGKLKKYGEQINHDQLMKVDYNDTTINLTLSAVDEKQVLLILLYQDRKPIDFPNNLFFSKEKENQTLMSYRPLSVFKNYWQSESAQPSLLWQQLSEDLLEIPYPDDPKDYVLRYGDIAFHPNHGTMLGLRTMVLVQCYWQLFKKMGIEDAQYTAQKMSDEEIHCLMLASFLLRSGRTNELSWDDDSTYGPRSAFIFTTIARELGYSEKIIQDIADCFDFDKELSHDAKDQKHFSKKHLYQTLLQLAHQSDLIRCKRNPKTIVDKISSIFERTLACDCPDNQVNQFLLFAAILCKNTGAPILPVFLQEPLGISSLGGNSSLLVKSTHHVELILNNLQKLADLFLSSFQCKEILSATTDANSLYMYIFNNSLDEDDPNNHYKMDNIPANDYVKDQLFFAPAKENAQNNLTTKDQPLIL